MGKDRFAAHNRQFAGAPRTPCLYAAELHGPDGVLLKVGVSGNALGRLMSLRAEAKRDHGAVLGRYSIFTTNTVSGAFEAEARALKALGSVASPVDGRREFFSGLSFDLFCAVVGNATRKCHRVFVGDARPVQQVSESTKCGGVGGLEHAPNVVFFA